MHFIGICIRNYLRTPVGIPLRRNDSLGEILSDWSEMIIVYKHAQMYTDVSSITITHITATWLTLTRP